MTEAQAAEQLLRNAWPVIYSAGFAGLVCLILLYILYRLLSQYTEAQIKNTLMLEEITKDLRQIVDKLGGLERHLERRQR